MSSLNPELQYHWYPPELTYFYLRSPQRIALAKHLDAISILLYQISHGELDGDEAVNQEIENLIGKNKVKESIAEDIDELIKQWREDGK